MTRKRAKGSRGPGRQAGRVRLLLAAFMLVTVPGQIQAAQKSTLIVNARIVDGSGSPARAASVRVEGDTIKAVGELTPRAGEQVIDAAGHLLSPGFIDTHSHHDGGLFEAPDALPVISQGITTIIVGQDGGSELPLSPLFERMRKHPVAVNIGSYIGHNSVRAAVLGEDYKRKATAAEIEHMRTLVREGMEAGAIGLSTGLEYDPGIYSSKEEVLILAKEAARFGGRYISHMRSEDRFIWDALDEIVEIGRVTGMPVQVSHMKLAMTDLWGQADRFLGVMNRARAAGVDITGDVYPYEYWQSTLTVMFPDRDFTNRKAAEFALQQIAKPEGLLLSSFSPDPSLVGKTVADVAKQRGIDPTDALMQLIAESQAPGAEESVIGTSMDSKDVAKLIAWPYSNISSDGQLAGRHPRGTGAFPRVLRLYVRDQPLLTLEQAIHKMTGAAAAHMGMADRGLIRPGMKADLVLFDPDRIADRATSEDPNALSVGVQRVWVNGEQVFEDSRPTGVRSGRTILRSAPVKTKAAP
ncbi:N-acyl-D-amino-acid deacylase family protein [Sphingosinicella rhizophila]|uniref:D-aminoacylase n=1 Tax=Sphingosinicella rhizophila TaxID=3050082 RepID=A0ABU3Q8I1_9SPHN|nr:D-aminoacylase [Sphingosinicella sp. GR2756]MDT9599720.1 D-aminoacylase [Sphingosinicella sp. GR2756]